MEWFSELFKGDLLMVILGAVYVLIEFFLGKTNLVKAGSVLELVLNGAKKILNAFGVKKPELK